MYKLDTKVGIRIVDFYYKVIILSLIIGLLLEKTNSFLIQTTADSSFSLKATYNVILTLHLNTSCSVFRVNIFLTEGKVSGKSR